MPHNPTLLENRNKYIKERYRTLKKRNPKWRYEALIEQVAEDIFLSPATVAKILKEDNSIGRIPCVDTVIKYTRPPQLALAL